MQVLGLILFFGTFYFLWILRNHEGWKKSLVLSGAWLSSLGILAMLNSVFHWPNEIAVRIGISTLVLWTAGLYFYSKRKGYITGLF